MPEEVAELRERKGTLNVYVTTLLYGESEAREMVDYLFILRLAVEKHPTIPLDGLKLITKEFLEFKAEKWPSHYGVPKTVGLLKEAAVAIKAVKTLDEYLKLIEAIHQYINIWSFWMDLQIPWSEMSTIYDWVVLEKDATLAK